MEITCAGGSNLKIILFENNPNPESRGCLIVRLQPKLNLQPRLWFIIIVVNKHKPSL